MEIQNFIEIGTIVAPQGLQGELKITTDSDFPERFETPGNRWLQIQPQQQPQPIELLKGKQIPGKNVFIIKLAGINDRNQAESLRGSKLFVEKGDRPYLDEEEYHVADLVNLQVYNQQTGENIGIVTNIFTAGNDILEVTLHRQPELQPDIIPDLDKISRVSKKRKFKVKKQKLITVLIPFVRDIVPVVDLKKGIMEINPPEGLFDLE
ncbi:MAG: ribosome maturation factor RimM [Cyanobacteria bacterium]|nr:ribosome maturation factor RimM [Cyanobacteria bacterium CG_2015-16_32_12]NCO78019.1 ribosome maturation factor RimM [Cyanobacteria bacterium CG_2015-22_32_23]NCQ05189.1 ribosome maturation factor RimM [Cyanobacteria bacterium CG_2015-09_32_10]NCQ42886.1 ribosome maturation factor RimM [Cyanobacteria bacterium CG_2015-04_32_10]NCS85163.1 ribosome maturation factor RimM [Cyanobacteria bacterium CG_2015-02_32_10]